MRWFLEHIQVVIAVAGIIAWWLNQRRREKEGQSADYDGDGTPERNPTAEPYDDEQARRVREDIRRKIAERRGLATPAPAATEPPPLAQAPAPREEAPPPVFQDPLQDMLKDIESKRNSVRAKQLTASTACMRTIGALTPISKRGT